MNELLTRQQYEEKVERDLRGAFPWIKDAIMRPAPGHLGLVGGFLRDVQEIAGLNKLDKGLRFLHVTRGEDSDLRIFFEIARLSPARAAAINDARNTAMMASKRFCAACHVRTSGRQRFCDDHLHGQRLFADDPEAAQPEEDGESRVIGGLFDLPGDEPHREPEAPAGAADAQPSSAPEVPVFDPAGVAALEKSMEGRDSDVRGRIKEVVKKLKATAAEKPLATIPADWQGVLDRFAADFPNFGEFVDFLRDQFALADMGDRRLAFPPVLFDGDAGIGKTEVTLSLAELLETGKLVVDMASAQCGAALAGSDAYWSNSREGQLFETLAYGRTANPVVVLDELDKASGDERYRPDSALYQLLEPRTAARFVDLSVREFAVDASHVLWFATTNDLGRLDAPIRSRFTVFHVPSPNREQTVAIAKSMYRRQVAGSPWGSAFAPEITETVARRLAEYPPRMIRTLIQRACGHAARNGRSELVADDIVGTTQNGSRGIGFLREVA